MNDSMEPRFTAGGSRNPVDDRLAHLAARSAERRRELDAPSPGAVPWGAPPPPGRRPGKRRHAAKGSRVAALALSLFSTLGLGVYLQQANASSSSSSIPLVTVPSTTGPSGTSATGSSSNGSASAGSGSGVTSTGLSDGTFTGSAANNKYGNVQVQVVVAGGQVTKVDIVQYPDRDRKSVDINNGAIPELISETLAAQSAKVDNVSGATYTSASYEQSVQSAIDQAHAGTSST
jgi:uncharacterized protein with FMN-binding domain